MPHKFFNINVYTSKEWRRQGEKASGAKKDLFTLRERELEKGSK